MKILDIFNDENVSESEHLDLRLRRAVRVVVFDSENKIAIVHSRKRNFYELPGGGVEEKETYQEAAIRECKEEIGCDIKIESELGFIIEYRKLKNLKKESYGYIAKVNGAKEKLDLADDELDLKIVIKWVSVEKAIQLIKSSKKSLDYIAELCPKRDITFLEELKNRH